MSAIIDPIRAHLEANKATTGVKAVGGVADLMAALDGLVTSPSQFVVRGAGTGRSGSAGTGFVIQDATVNFDVLTGFNRQSLKGTLDLVDQIAGRTEALIVGWAHPAGEPCEFRSDGYARIDPAANVLLFRQSFSTTRTIRSVA